MAVTNEKVFAYCFLNEMMADRYFPKPLVRKGQEILSRLCEKIEAERPATLAQLYVLTHAATEEFNALDEEFGDAGSELETAARENIGRDFAFIAEAYGFDADVEELIATREW